MCATFKPECVLDVQKRYIKLSRMTVKSSDWVPVSDLTLTLNKFLNIFVFLFFLPVK